MSQENAEIVRQGYEHYNRTGEPDYGAFDPEVQWISDPTPARIRFVAATS
jgi:hypothetical protein